MSHQIMKQYRNKQKTNSVTDIETDPLIKATIDSGAADNSASIKNFSIDLSMHPNFYTFVISDLHIGASGCNLQKFIRDLKLISQIPNAVIIINGDALQNSTLSGASNAHFDKCNPEDQLRILFKLIGVKEIKSKVILVVSGNHENGARSRDSGLDVLKHFSSGMGYYLIHADYNYAITIQALTKSGKKYPVRIAGRHGSGSANENGGTIDQAKNMLKVVSWADIVYISHFHKGAVAKEYQIIIDEMGNRKLSTVNLISTSSYEEYDQFPASMAMSPSNTDNYLQEICLIDNPLLQDTHYSQRKMLPKYSVEVSLINMGSPKIEEIIENFKTNTKSNIDANIFEKTADLKNEIIKYCKNKNKLLSKKELEEYDKEQ